MSLQLVLGKSGSGKSYYLYNEIINKSIQNEKTNYLILVPEQFTLQTQKDIVSMHPRQGTMNIDILSFMRLAYRIFDEVGEDDRPVLEDTGKSMVLRKLVAARRKELELFNHDVQKQGFIDELKSLISEIYQYSISIEKLEEMEQKSQGKPMLRGKLHDIIVIYKAFREYLSENYITAEEILDVLCEAIPKSKLIAESIICLDGFTGFTPAQYKLLLLLIQRAKKVIITITMDKYEMDKPDLEYKLFHLSKKTIKHLMDLGEMEQITVDPPIFMENVYKSRTPYRYKESRALAALEESLFRYPVREFKEEQSSISIHAAKAKKQEVNLVIREIKHLVREKGYRYQDIAVVTGDIAGYGRELQRGFEKAGIACFIDHKRDILSNPFVEFLRSALSIVAENFDYESIFRYLRSGLSGILQDDTDLLENYILALGIRGFNCYSTPFIRRYKGLSEGDLTRINETRQTLYEQILPLYQILKDKTKTVKEYTLGLYEFGIKMEVPQELEKFAEAFREQKLLAAAREYDQIYGIVMDLYDKLVELLGEEVIPLKDYIKILEAGLKEAKVGLIPPGLDQVMVGDIKRTRLKDIKALFFVGANDGIIPGSNDKGGILTDMERQALSEQNLELAPTQRQAAYTEKFYLYLAMTKPQERLYITFSKLSEDGKAVRPSYIIDTVRKIFPLLTIQDEEDFNEDLEHILGDNNGMDYLIKGIRNLSVFEETDTWKELFSYYHSKEEFRDTLRQLSQAATYVNQDKGLSKQIAGLLYGNILSGSVTRFEKYAACAFAHYVTYGLELQERQEYRLAVPDIGNLFHNAIELFSRKMSESEYNWHTIPDVIRDTWAAECVQEAAQGYGNAIFSSSKRYNYLVKRVERITKRTLWALSEQIKKGDFEPLAYELFFSEKSSLNSLNIDLSKEKGIRLQGRIDRLDLCEEENKLMVRVIDYKSGTTSFDLLSLYYGLQIQLAVYMSAALELMEQEHPDKEVIPAGILYYNIDDPFVDKGSNAEESILKELKMNGIVNSDAEVIKRLDKTFQTEGEQIRPSVKSDVIPVESNKDGLPTKRSSIADAGRLKRMEDYVIKTVKQYGDAILQGKTDIKPYQMGKRTACDYCPYKSVCGFDTKLNGYAYRNLGSLSTEEVWEKLTRKNGNKEGGDSSELDD
ncbi:ATP-dependent helicase/deoxyribonuclease subunit B [Anaerocolumna cellulosilytica]|uniref:ATP-dependent helicase/deoxyribonuclease subunit B n=1 Tax=Anaerocolumna cellulosilytica TaxID=433286 RepID=A0A6S6QYD8_9FIRM|nr:helicase-exonuclease AddAB subunit AddB [Anaerocolumna cellulosilytica]MBB5197818.1 ATP-dependent helicase/nuclease subunit B [Anaerocolumna cellulosilytica]BCJ96233.1 ATP-dependent helicase/deoxyribonuclease subunit B [Anaerocolumna cellulosilytica]